MSKRVLISGALGHMGQAVLASLNAGDGSLVPAVGIDLQKGVFPGALFSSADQVDVPFDVAIDFSRPAAAMAVLDLCLREKKPLVIGTTAEIVETHHNLKVDAPSGTALMLAEAIEGARAGESELVFGRHETNKRRTKEEIGIHSLRGGNKAGEHSVYFLGTDEEIIITHRAGSKRVFADGAVKAAAFLLEQRPGFYTMKDVIRM